jgi:hypothetical protein
MWVVFDNDSGAALRGANPRACFSIADENALDEFHHREREMPCLRAAKEFRSLIAPYTFIFA